MGKQAVVGQLAGKYEPIRLLGAGGMGEVYLVRHVDLGVLYALKLLDQAMCENERFIEQFKREAAVLQSFAHPGITQLRDFGRTEEGRYYLAMDYCEGRSLKEVLDEDGPYPVKAALRITIQLLNVLEAAHEHGIIHRDIKPANIMVIGDDREVPVVKVLDFGTAMLREGLDPTAGEYASVGTPCYMSPEQASGAQNLDQRVDIYAVGIVMYELLTGEVPFEGENVLQTLLLHVTQPPPSFAVLYGMPEFIEELLFKALRKKRDERYQSAAEFRRACEIALDRYAREFSPLGADDREPEAPAPESVPQPAKPSGQQRTKILCLDDDEMILNIVRHVLEMHGYEVFTALDCSAIHDFLFREKVDLLLSDVQMPGLPGTKVCRLIKSSFQELKVVLFSNVPERDLERYSKENGADGWISKTTRPEEWLAVIREVLEGEGEVS